MKARAVKHLDPAGPVGDNAERIVRTRLDELYGFMPAAADPAAVTELHDMRIAAKRLRYVLEVTHPCFGPYAKTAVKHVKELQDLLGEIHDCDVQAPAAAALLEALVEEDAQAVAEAAAGEDDLEPRAAAGAPHAKEWAGVAALVVFLRARRRLLFARFLEVWRDHERKGLRARLEYAVAERSPRPEPAADIIGREA